MELKRNIYEQLVRWKKQNSGKVLELQGARQTGKTFILDKFARENYKEYIYINMVQSSGKRFLKCLEKVLEWEPGMPVREKPLHEAFDFFHPGFTDNEDTVIVIDEIQESSKVYSHIREFAREFSCHFIMTGSYLGKTLEKEYFLPAGDIDSLTLYTLSFEEFLDAFGKRELFDQEDLYGGSDHYKYDDLKTYYDIYCQIGGYPAVVKTYVESQDLTACREELYRIIHIFIEESHRYFEDILEINLFEQLFPAIAHTMIREKKGSDDLITELSKLIYKQESNRVTKKSIHYAIAWLYRSKIIGFCGKANDCSSIDVTMNCRFYFLDIGVCRYFLDIAGADLATLRGIVNENFVYIDLLKRTLAFQLAGTAPMFGTYKEGEIDFLINNRKNYKNYGIEVKAGKSVGRTAQQLLKDEKVEAVYFLKGDTYGGMVERMIMVPIYLVGRIMFGIFDNV